MGLLHLDTSRETHPSSSASSHCDKSPVDYGTNSTATVMPPSSSSSVTHRASAAAAAAAATASTGKIIVEDSSDDDARKATMARTKELALSLVERYHNATSTKMYDVEELVDFYFHRRLAAVSAVVISYLPFVITPNQITLFGLALGWASATCLYDSEFHAPLAWEPHNSLLAAGLLMFLWIVSDCADGQVARLCKRGTRTGRILDGVVDGLVIAPNCFVIGLLLSNRYSDAYFVLALLAGFSLWVHAIVYDKIKNIYMENALPQSECDGETVESVTKEFHEAKAKAPYSLDCVLLGIYVVYLTVQAKLTSDAASEAEANRHQLLAKCNDQYRASYMNKYGYVVRIASFMGISAHVSGLYVAYLAAIYYWDALVFVQLYFLVALNLVLLMVLFLYFKSGMATQQPLNSAM